MIHSLADCANVSNKMMAVNDVSVSGEVKLLLLSVVQKRADILGNTPRMITVTHSSITSTVGRQSVVEGKSQ
jgi:hypothetical protein